MQIDLDSLTRIGSGLNRPECVLTHSSGCVFVPDWSGNGGISIIHPDGSVRRLLAKAGHPLGDESLRPNGIALEAGGSFLIAHLGETRGAILRLFVDGSVETVLDAVDGEPLPPANFVTVDNRGRLWITVSTRRCPRALAYRADVSDGFIVLMDEDGARIVADDLGYTNECLLAEDGSTLFVNETFARRLSAFSIDANGGLGSRRTVARFGSGDFPDGLAMDQSGALWITSIISNRLLRVDTNGRVETVLEDVDPDHLEWVERAYRDNAVGRPHLDHAAGRRLANISSLAFAGPDGKTAYLGCLLDDAIHRVDMPVKGRLANSCNADLGALGEAIFAQADDASTSAEAAGVTPA